MIEKLRKVIVGLAGWKATVLFGDPLTFDRWKWLRRHLLLGTLRTFEVGSDNIHVRRLLTKQERRKSLCA